MLNLVTGFTNTVDDDDYFQTGLLVFCLEPAQVVDDGGGPDFDTTVVAIDCRVPPDPAVVEAPGLSLGHKQRDVQVQRPLIRFEREDLVSLSVEDSLGDRTLASHRASGTIAPSISKLPKSLEMAVISIDFTSTLTWPRTSRWRAANAETM